MSLKEIILNDDFNYLRELVDYHSDSLPSDEKEWLLGDLEVKWNYREIVEQEINKLRIKKFKQIFPDIKCIHLSKTPVYKEMLKSYNQHGVTGEPKGLYYSTNYKRYKEGNYSYKYLYGIIFNHSKIYTNIYNFNPELILKISSKKELIKFMSIFMVDYPKYLEDQYNCISKTIKNKGSIGGSKKKIEHKKKILSPKLSPQDIKFDYLAKCFAGIEFAYNGGMFKIPYKDKIIKGSLDYYAIQDYGCIWNTNIIKELKLMFLIPEGFNERIYLDLLYINEEIEELEQKKYKNEELKKKKVYDDKTFFLTDIINELTILRDKTDS